jgi:fatty-acyl-CoA synthase
MTAGTQPLTDDAGDGTPPEFTMPGLLDAVTGRYPDRYAVVQGSRRVTYADLADRSTRLARYLTDRGLGVHTERDRLAGHQIGQDLLAQYLHNSPEYLEGLVGACRGRLAPFNVNYRYVAEELRYLFTDAAPKVIQYHARFAPLLAEVLPDIPPVAVLLQVADDSGQALLPGAVDYEQALASVPAALDVTPCPDDVVVLYTGGTTGRPKGVLWRQADAAVVMGGVRNHREGNREWTSPAEKLAAMSETPSAVLPLPPFMHGVGQSSALQTLFDGNTVVIPENTTRFDPGAVFELVERHDVAVLTMVGDAFARPLVEELDHRPREYPGVRMVFSSGAALSARHKERLAVAFPTAKIWETVGSSEVGVQGVSAGGRVSAAGRPTFSRRPTAHVVSEDLTRLLEPGHERVGWLATGGRIPLGYLHDEAKTRRTFPLVEGRRMCVPGDRARLLPDDVIEFLGRDSVTINSGGEKIFAEEVEAAVVSHPDVVDAVVCGRPSERWGSEVVALVALRDGAEADPAALVAHCAGSLARYKLPKVVQFVPEIPRTAAGKADYRWAQQTAQADTPTRSA